MTPGGLPVGLEIDGPLGTDRRLIAHRPGVRGGARQPAAAAGI